MNEEKMDDADDVMVSDERNSSMLGEDAISGRNFGGIFESDDRRVPVNANHDDNWWTLCQLPIFLVLFAVVGVIAVTFVVSITCERSRVCRQGER